MDITALANLIETDPRYAVALQDGNNGEITRLLNEDDLSAGVKWQAISGPDFLDAISSEVLTPAQEARIQTYLYNNGNVPLDRANVRQWIIDQNFTPPTMANLRAYAEVQEIHGEVALQVGERRISLRDVRQAVRQTSSWFGDATQRAAREATKQAYRDAEDARRARIESEILAEGPAGIRQAVRNQFSDAAKRLKAEILLRVREERAAEAMLS
jgi:hypothetical protein